LQRQCGQSWQRQTRIWFSQNFTTAYSLCMGRS
jgi:hypothetical protein